MGGSDVELFCHSSFVRVWFGPAQKNKDSICVVMQSQFGLGKHAAVFFYASTKQEPETLVRVREVLFFSAN